GCNETYTASTQGGKPVLVAAMGMYTQGACTSWEPPETSVYTPPAHGRVTTVLGKSPLTTEGHPCKGAMIDRMMTTYYPNPGFRGQDRFTLKYDYITDDGGGRATTSGDFIVNVK